MNRLKVGVSPYFTGKNWTDEHTNIRFERSELGAMNIYSIPEDAKLEGIRRALQMNRLTLLEGTLPKEEVKVEVKKEEVKVEAKKETATRGRKKKEETKEA